MPIRFRCRHCGQPMSISRRRAGAVVACTTCGQSVVVPMATADRQSAASVSEAPQEPHPFANPATEPPEFASHTLASQSAEGAPPAAWPEGRPDEELELSGDSPQVELTRVRRKLSGDSDDFDLMPMVDLTFLLLIFFMLTMSFTVQKSLAMPRQEPEPRGARQALPTIEELANDFIVVRVDADNAIFVDNEKIAAEQLTDKIRSVRRTTERAELLLTTDDLSWHETTVQVIDAASAAGVEHVRYAAPKASTALSRKR